MSPGTQLYGVTTLAQPFLAVAHFGVDLFGANFTKIMFFCCFLFQFISVFLIYKNYFFHYFFFFQKQLKIFCLFLMNFFSLNVKNTSSNTPLLFFYSAIPVADKIYS